MGREQRSRRKIPEGTVCYLCGKPILSTDRWNRDHLPPARFFASIVRPLIRTRLNWLYTHESCNSAYREDEEYAIVVLAGHAESRTGNAVMDDLRAAFGEGHSRGLIKAVVGGFGRLVGPRGEVLFQFDRSRVDRIAWKLVRGLYYRELGAVLPEKRPGHVYLINRQEAASKLAEIKWYPDLRNTAPMGDDAYSKIFDYKWICQKDGELRGHAVGMLWWDGVILLVIFHDPACGCSTCSARKNAVNEREQSPESRGGE